MSYTTSYTDEEGKKHDLTISDDDSREALCNDYNALMKIYSTKYVSIQRVQAQPGEELHLRITVNAPTHYLTSSNDTSPKCAESMTVDIIAYLGYPYKGVSASYDPHRYLASPNVFRSGTACIDEWKIGTSSLLTVAEKLIQDIIHNPLVTRYDSEANCSMDKWHKENVNNGAFPTINPRLLLAPQTSPLPTRKSRTTEAVAPPPLPSRKHERR